MIINIIGESDKRPITYCTLKILQEFGDVLYISSESRVMRLSEDRQQFSHYQNIMVAYTEDGFDDFFDECGYTPEDFSSILVENLECSEADLVLYVAGMSQSEFEAAALEYIEDYATINLFHKNIYDSAAMRKVEEFEAYANLCPMPPKIVNETVNALLPLNLAPVKSLVKIASRDALRGSGKTLLKR